MGKMTFDGINDYLEVIDKIGGNSESVAIDALYAGAGALADEMRKSVNNIPVDDNVRHRPEGKMLKGITSRQKAGLLKSLSIKPFEKNAYTTSTKISFVGRNNVKTKKYPNGQPNSLIARSVESGSSFMVKNPFVAKTYRKSKKLVEETMKKKVEEAIDRLRRS